MKWSVNIYFFKFYTNFVIFSTVLYSNRWPRIQDGAMGHGSMGHGSMGHGSLVQWVTWVMGQKSDPLSALIPSVSQFLDTYQYSRNIFSDDTMKSSL